MFLAWGAAPVNCAGSLEVGGGAVEVPFLVVVVDGVPVVGRLGGRLDVDDVASGVLLLLSDVDSITDEDEDEAVDDTSEVESAALLEEASLLDIDTEELVEEENALDDKEEVLAALEDEAVLEDGVGVGVDVSLLLLSDSEVPLLRLEELEELEELEGTGVLLELVCAGGVLVEVVVGRLSSAAE